MKKSLPTLLFHYTKYEKAIKILESGEIKLFDFSGANDIAEQKYSGEYKYQSFCGANSSEEGATKPRMWAQYGGLNKGCCIVLKTKKYIEVNNIKKDKIFCIKYHFRNWFFKNKVNAGDKRLLRNKLLDWKEEKEVRIISKIDTSYSIKGCVEKVYIGHDCKEMLQESNIWNEYTPSIVTMFGSLLTTEPDNWGEISAELRRKYPNDQL